VIAHADASKPVIPHVCAWGHRVFPCFVIIRVPLPAGGGDYRYRRVIIRGTPPSNTVVMGGSIEWPAA
jgi:hypothetical protein